LDSARWLAGLSGLVGSVGAGLQVTDTQELIGTLAETLFMYAIVLTGLSFAIAAVAVIAMSLQLEKTTPPGRDVGPRGWRGLTRGWRGLTRGWRRVWLYLAAVLFGGAVILAAVSAAASRQQAAENQSLLTRRPLVSYEVTSAKKLSVTFSIKGVSRIVPVALEIRSYPRVEGVPLPSKHGYTDERGGAALTLEVQNIQRFQGRTLSAIAFWSQRIEPDSEEITPLECVEPILSIPLSPSASMKNVPHLRANDGPLCSDIAARES
jgi:hypothetical protein